jgi:hypothetical protein
MAMSNLIVLLLLSPVGFQLSKEHFNGGGRVAGNQTSR